MPPVKRTFTIGCYLCACAIAPISLAIPSAWSQAANPVTSPQETQTIPKSSDVLSAALNQVSQALGNMNVSRWKAPGEVRGAAQQNAESIQRDLHDTLPGLLAQADAAPGSVTAIFPVYRNIDALYDVLLRISQSANLAAPREEAANIDSALSQLESARKNLGNAVFSAAKAREDEVVKLHTLIAQNAAAARQAPPPKTTVIDDGPVKTSSARRHKKKPAPASPAAPPATQPPQ